MSFEASAMEVVGLIQRWRDQVRREVKEGQRGLRVIVFAEKKKILVMWHVRIGWHKTHLLCQLLTQFILILGLWFQKVLFELGKLKQTGTNKNSKTTIILEFC